MFKFIHKAALSLALLMCLPPALSPAAMAAPVTLEESTRLILRNASSSDVTCMVVVPAPGGAIEQDGCPTAVSDLRFLVPENSEPQKFEQFGASTQGWLRIPPGHMAEIVNAKVDPYTNQRNFCLQGLVVGFGQFGNSCAGDTLQQVPAFPDAIPGPNFNKPISPPILLPNGSNSAEPSLNLPHKIRNAPGGGANESVDISCVNGVNCTLQMKVTPPSGGPYWAYNGGTKSGGDKHFTSTLTAQNSWVNIAGRCDDNCVDRETGLPRPGVYPYGCTMCNIFPDPAPPCPPPNRSGAYPSQFCAVQNGLPPNNGCGFNRSPAAGQRFGGTIEVTYLGPLAPPARCP